MTSSEEKKADCSPPSPPGIAHTLARPNILALHPYRCARDDYSTGILLDANENPIGPTALPTQSTSNTLTLERYPCPYQIPLKTKYLSYRDVSGTLGAQNVFVGVGSDEAIDLLMRIFCRPGVDNVVVTPPTYGMYKVSAAVNDVEVVKVDLTEGFDVRVEETLAATNSNTKLLFICSPGNPTAKAIPLSTIITLASSPTYKGYIVVDEAYIDFSPVPSAISLLSTYPNIIVLQTLSKAFGLAGIRCGFALGCPDVIQLMNNVKAPYNVNSLTSEVAMNALDRVEDVLKKNVECILEQRGVVMEALGRMEFVVKVFESDANFVLFRLKSHAKEVYKVMADQGVVTRYRGTEVHCDECIRVSIGTEEENKAFLKLLVETYNTLTQ
eukprot:CAMPEP_0185729932 /NCGR_PEP_ID=MMETSP1171-20130828/7761_1 /TAXON_ID=374046 /ORGANISM="Helicotheca tamensis, Strain CCMP826" /LENGTH=383 /DNA_ID=CAMNT_0028398875 /DNA_START=175 /DNA_END=1326 /DNA_ORIENTATION=-